MSDLRSLTVLAIRSGASADTSPPEEASALIGKRGGERLTERDRAELWAFLSPTEAVLAGLDACDSAPGGGVSVGIAIGEVSGDGDAIEGETVVIAQSLAKAAKTGMTLFSKAANLAVNHNEVGGDEEGWVDVKGTRSKVRAFRAKRGRKSEPVGSSAPMASADTAAMASPSGAAPVVAYAAPPAAGPGWVPCLLLIVLGGLAGWGLRGNCQRDDFALARRAQSRGENLYAIDLALAAWKRDPGNPAVVEFIGRVGSEQCEAFRKAGRVDRSLALLRRLRKTLPFSDPLEDVHFKAASGQLRNWVLAGRIEQAREEEQRLIAELPGKSTAVSKVFHKARLDQIEEAIGPVIRTKKRYPYKLVNGWNTTLNEVYKVFPDWGQVEYLWGRICVLNSRWSYLGDHYTGAIRKTPAYAESRTIFADLMKACESTSTGQVKYLESCRRVLSDSLGDWVIPELVKHLGAAHSAVRVIAYRALEGRGALPDKGLLDYHVKNVALTMSAREKKHCISKREIAAALDHFLALTAPDEVTRARQALESMPDEARFDGDVADRARQVLDMLKAKGK